MGTANQCKESSVAVGYAQITGRLGYARKMVCMKLAGWVTGNCGLPFMQCKGIS